MDWQTSNCWQWKTLKGIRSNFNDPVINMAGSSRCIDIGHLWLDDHDPVDFFPGRIEQTTVIHLHGIKERDHQSLAHMPQKRIDDFFRILLTKRLFRCASPSKFFQKTISTLRCRQSAIVCSEFGGSKAMAEKITLVIGGRPQRKKYFRPTIGTENRQ